jgi:hypothetical protein
MKVKSNSMVGVWTHILITGNNMKEDTSCIGLKRLSTTTYFVGTAARCLQLNDHSNIHTRDTHFYYVLRARSVVFGLSHTTCRRPFWRGCPLLWRNYVILQYQGRQPAVVHNKDFFRSYRW